MDEREEPYTYQVREAIKKGLCAPGEQHNYIVALEIVAKAAIQYSHNSTPANLSTLQDALARVDWMQE